MSKLIEEKYIATVLLHAVGDTIGFKNGKWEFIDKKEIYGATLEKLYEFFALGGINDIKMENWWVSDDTLLHMAVGRALIMDYNNIETLEKNTVKQFIKARDGMVIDLHNDKNRYIGRAVDKHCKLLKDGKDWHKFEYDPTGGGNGAAMRNNCIGLAMFGEENRKTLIRYAINSSKMTHVNPIGWLGGLSTALFTAFILEDIHIYRWVPEMLKIIESNEVKQYLDQTNVAEIREYDEFLRCWKTYYEARFSDEKPVKNKTHTHLIKRLVFYNNVFDVGKMGMMGTSGYSAVIVAYDCLVDAENSWEKLVVYSTMNNFDSDTIGAIACGLYGTLYGLKNVPVGNLMYIEMKEKLVKIGKLLYRKYFKHENLHI